MAWSMMPLIPPAHQALAILNQAAPVQNTWYTILDTTANVRLYWIEFEVALANETLEIRLTIDGQVLTGTRVATFATPYFAYLEWNASLGTQTSRILIGYSEFLDGRSVKIELRKTTAAGAGNLSGNVTYQRW